METREYKTVDKSTWDDGPWKDEPDKKQWQEETTGLPCLIVRNHMGALCGYVGVPKDHPLYEAAYDSPHESTRLLWEKVQHEPIGKRGIIPFMLAVFTEGIPRLDCIFNVHGGLTYSNHCQPNPGVTEEEHEARAVCHTTEGDDSIWWFGFDCGHAGDKVPKMSICFNDDIYRDFDYVTAEVTSLAKQLKELGASSNG